jgi:hypothetical protein
MNPLSAMLLCCYVAMLLCCYAVCCYVAMSLYRYTIPMALHITHPPPLSLCGTDNYQGEEADVVLISLVRCNDAGSIGFLKEPERVNVLLSRARHGMIIVSGEDCKDSLHLCLILLLLLLLHSHQRQFPLTYSYPHLYLSFRPSTPTLHPSLRSAARPL